jgi:hypothetical protein
MGQSEKRRSRNLTLPESWQGTIVPKAHIDQGQKLTRSSTAKISSRSSATPCAASITSANGLLRVQYGTADSDVIAVLAIRANCQPIVTPRSVTVAVRSGEPLLS